MSQNAHIATDANLVSRYAERVRAQRHRPLPELSCLRQSNGLQTFGRAPITRKRARSDRSKRAITTLMATAIMAAAAPSMTAQASSTYEIQSGDTLTDIAQQHGVSIDDLIRINGISDPDLIHAGAQLRLSDADQDDYEIREGDTVYEIKSGDTLYGIATAHGVSLGDLITINEIESEDMIYVGDFLIIPTGESDDDHTVDEAPAGQQSDDQAGDESHIVSLHLVATGETPSGIALRYGITVDQLMRANGLSNGDIIRSGEMLRIPDASWDPSQNGTTVDHASTETDQATLENMPVHQQSLTQSSQPAAMSIATSYWGQQVSEWVFIENMPYHQNPHRGYRGDMDGKSGGTKHYGVYPKPLSAILSNYGFVGEEFYTMGDPAELKERIDRGQPVMVWMTEGATQQNRFFEWYQGERFTLVPHQHVVVVYGYDDENIYVSDPGTGQYAAYSWNAFINSWSQFDGMSMAVYPKG